MLQPFDLITYLTNCTFILQSAYYMAGIKLSEHPCESVDLQRHLPSKSSTTTSSVIAAEEAFEALREEPDSVFGDDDSTLTHDVTAPARKQPRLSTVSDIFASSPPATDLGILTPFFGVYKPGDPAPEVVRLQILDILRFDSSGYLDLHLSDGEWYSRVKVSASFRDYFL